MSKVEIKMYDYFNNNELRNVTNIFIRKDAEYLYGDLICLEENDNSVFLIYKHSHVIISKKYFSAIIVSYKHDGIETNRYIQGSANKKSGVYTNIEVYNDKGKLDFDIYDGNKTTKVIPVDLDTSYYTYGILRVKLSNGSILDITYKDKYNKVTYREYSMKNGISTSAKKELKLSNMVLFK